MSSNAYLDRGEHTVQLNHRYFGYVLAMLRERLPETHPALRVSRGWLQHIEQEMGFVLLDEAPLEDRDGVRALRREIGLVLEALERGDARFPAYLRPEITEDGREFATQNARRMVDFLDAIIADQKAEDAGLKPPAPSPKRWPGPFP